MVFTKFEGLGGDGLELRLQLFYYFMNNLETIVSKIYGKRLRMNLSQGNPHFLFNVYQDILTRETYYLKTIELPTFLYISQASTEIIAHKYGSLIPQFKITPVDRHFQAYTYLVRAPFNIMPITSYLQVKRECGEVIDIDFFLRFLEFAEKSFKILEGQGLPLFTIGQIGLTESKEFILSDPAFYFTGHNKHPQNYQFGPWMASFVRQVLNLPLDKQEQQVLLLQYFGQYLQVIRSFLEYLMSGQADIKEMEGRLLNAISRISEDTSTISGSSVDMNELIQRTHGQGSLMRQTKFKKMGILAKMVILFVVLAILAGIGIFCLKFFTRSLQCSQGEFLNPSNQCISCPSGCLRCDDVLPDKCTKCNINMYLVIANDDDKQGYCMTQCHDGRVIKVDVCVKDTKNYMASNKNIFPFKDEKMLLVN